MSPGRRPSRFSIGTEDAPHNKIPKPATTSPKTTRDFPSGAMTRFEGAANSPRRCAGHVSRACHRSSLRVRASLRGFPRLLGLLDYLLGDRRRHFVVMRETRLERPASRSYRAQVRRILQNFRHRHQRLDHLSAALAVHPEHPAPARIEVADNVAHAFVWAPHLDRHNRFEQNRPRLLERGLESHRRRYLKSHIGRVDFMIAAFENRYSDVDHRVAAEVTLDQRTAHALLDRRDVLARDRATNDLVHELEAASTRERFDLEPAVAILSASARLALVFALRLGLTLDRLLVWDLRRLKFNLYIKFSLELLDRDLDMHLARARQDYLMSLRVAMGLEGRVFLDQPLQCERRFFLVAPRLGRNRTRDHGQRFLRRLENNCC